MNQKIKNDAESAELNNQVNRNTIEENLQVRHEIQPFKFAVMVRHADKIIGQLVNTPSWVMTYDDIEFVLEMILDAVRKARMKQ